MIELEDKRVLVVGLGVSGFAAAGVTERLGGRVTVIDASSSPALADRVDELVSRGIEVRLGVGRPADLAAFDLVVASPGVPSRADVLGRARDQGINVISELELGSRLLENPMVAVTGTNGKTTTTALLGDILDRPGRRAVTCGNIGNPLVGLYGRVGPDEMLVVEVSSFQLANIEEFHPRVAVVLNVAPDHYDWHADFDDYVAAKTRITENQRPGDFLVYNSDDGTCVEIARGSSATTIGFGLEREAGSGVWLEDGWIIAGEPLRGATRVLPVGEMRLAGIHNILNVMAAGAAALAVGETPGTIRAAVASFEGLEHRMELVGSVSGVDFYNDSKATNPHATAHAVRSFDRPIVVILGGRNKGLDFSQLAEEVCGGLDTGKVRGVVLLGECAEDIESALRAACPRINGARLSKAGDMDETVGRALEMSGGNGVVLFSPACASFDMFTDYEERGHAFKECVERLGGEAAARKDDEVTR
jgi:UDP-N-acetylmuramoylalanine--D-glutamate ligase